MNFCHPQKFWRLPEGLLHQLYAPHQPFQNRTIPRLALPHLPFNERSVGFASLQSPWAFNFGHPCPPSKKGEVLLLGQAEPTMVGIVNALEAFMVALLSISIPFAPHQPFKNRTIPLAFRRARVCVCLYGFAFELSLSLFVGRGACPSRCINPCHSHNRCKRTIIPSPRTTTLAFK